MAKAKTPAKTQEVTEDTDIARKIWLAGVGAYGRMYTETQGAVEKLATGANEAFDQLVTKGEEVEDKVRETIAKSPRGDRVVSLVSAAADQVKAFRAEQRAALEARVGKVRKTVTETLAPVNISALSHAVEKLAVQVEQLTAEVASLKAEKVQPEKPAKAKTDAVEAA
jgi:poly(hydroxyalkanoate) granule-associated protein